MKSKPTDRNIHRPKHLYQYNQIYFITGRTYKQIKYFCSDRRKNMLCEVINKSAIRFNINIYGWVVLDNHYHLLLDLRYKNDNEFHPNQRFEFNSSNRMEGKYKLVEFIRKIHKDSSRSINKIDGLLGRKVWYQYWDNFIKSEKDFFGYLNYIHINPIKHEAICHYRKLSEYEFSSYGQYIKKYGDEWVKECFETYVIAD